MHFKGYICLPHLKILGEIVFVSGECPISDMSAMSMSANNALAFKTFHVIYFVPLILIDFRVSHKKKKRGEKYS